MHIGFSYDGSNGDEIFNQLRLRGCFAEDEMFSATGGINTHKGLIFSMGVLCCASAITLMQDCDATPHDITKMAQALAKNTIEKDLSSLNHQLSNGEEIFKNLKITGVRGELLSGFQSVTHHALPVFRHMMHDGHHVNDASIVTLLAIISKIDDTNIIHRSDIDTLHCIQTQLSTALQTQTPQQLIATAKELNIEWIKQHISAGGSADLLAVTLFLYFLTE